MYSMHPKVAVDSEAPDFKARDVLGREFSLAGYRGRNNLVLFFYRNHLCQTCREVLRDLAGHYGYIVHQDGEIVAISTDGIDVAKDMAVDLHLPFRVISDPDGGIIKEYGVYNADTDTADPTIFLIDKNGVVRFRKQIESLYDRVPADEIVNKLQGMGTPRGGTPFQSFRYE